jgi:chromate reductase
MRDGVEYAIYDGLREIPPYDEDLDAEGTPAAVADLKRAITEADGVLFATPEYNSSIPGQLKNAIDWVSRPFATNPLRNKPVAVIGSSTGMFGAMWAQAELRKVLAATGARVVDAELSVPKAQAHLGEGGSLAPEHDEGLADVVSALLEETRPKVTAAA